MTKVLAHRDMITWISSSRRPDRVIIAMTNQVKRTKRLLQNHGQQRRCQVYLKMF